MRLGGKVAIVTGSGRGIGKAIATIFAREGASPIINDIKKRLCRMSLMKLRVEAASQGHRADKAGARALSPYGINVSAIAPGTIVIRKLVRISVS